MLTNKDIWKYTLEVKLPESLTGKKRKIKDKEMKGFESSNEICSLGLTERINACVCISAYAIIFFFLCCLTNKTKANNSYFREANGIHRSDIGLSASNQVPIVNLALAEV